MAEWLYGRHAVEEALRAGRRRLHRILLSDGARGSAPEKAGEHRLTHGNRQRSGAPPSRFGGIEAAAREGGVPVERVAPTRLDSLSRAGHHHQGVVAEAGPFPYSPLAEVESLCRQARDAALVLILDSIQDPQNFGTLLRTAEAVGVTAVVMLDRRQVEITPAVVNASAGAVEHLRVCRTNNLPRAIESLKEAGLWVYALRSEPGASHYGTADLKGAIGLVVGSEGEGVGRLVRERCDGAIELPMRGKVESLNAAVAGSVVLYEALRQRTANNP